MNQPINIGTQVHFKRGGHTVTGKVKHLLLDIENSRKKAVVEIDHELPGIEEMVPVDELKALPIYLHASGEINALNPQTQDRRYFVVPN